MNLAEWRDPITGALELTGIAVILLGAAGATAWFVARLFRGPLEVAYREYRRYLGRSILLGLEFLVAGDIIATVSLEPTMAAVGVLGAIVLIRTFLSFSLEVEIEGRWPWNGRPGARAASAPSA